jgi:large subunit ribosomal protein L3
MSEELRRTGLIAKKLGMTQIFDKSGDAVPVTLLQITGNHVIGRLSKEERGYNAVVVSFLQTKTSRVSKPIAGIFAKAKVEPMKHIKEFRVSPDALLEVGKEISLTHFVTGQLVDIQGSTTGKGFAGVMKRYNFAGLEASHGVSVSHRSAGSTGQRQDPGKVFKGKKMAGHMGAVTTTIQNLQVVDIDENMGIIAVRGAVPGKKGSIIYVSDAVKKAVPVNAAFPAAIVE